MTGGKGVSLIPLLMVDRTCLLDIGSEATPAQLVQGSDALKRKHIIGAAKSQVDG